MDNDKKQKSSSMPTNGSQTNEQNSSPNHFEKPNTEEEKLTREELQNLVKEKVKENKTLQSKNTKLQTKYVDLFREQKTLKQDNQIFVEFIKNTFSEFQDKAAGTYNLNELQIALAQRQASFNNKMKEILEEAKNQIKENEAKVRQELEEKIKVMETQHKNSSDTTSQQLQSFKKNNKVLSEQFIDFEKRLAGKDEEISKLTKEKLKLQHQINNYKIKQMNEEFGESKKEEEEKKNNLERNQILRLSHEIDNLLDKRDTLWKQLKQVKQTSKKQKYQLQEKEKLIEELLLEIQSLKEEKEVYEKSVSVEDNISQPEKKEDMNFNIEDNIFQGDENYVHRQYVKNVFLRYLKCLRKGDRVHGDLLLNIIFTILRFSGEEKKLAEDKRKKWWGIY